MARLTYKGKDAALRTPFGVHPKGEEFELDPDKDAEELSYLREHFSNAACDDPDDVLPDVPLSKIAKSPPAGEGPAEKAKPGEVRVARYVGPYPKYRSEWTVAAKGEDFEMSAEEYAHVLKVHRPEDFVYDGAPQAPAAAKPAEAARARTKPAGPRVKAPKPKPR